MGVEIFHFGLPENSVAIRDAVDGKLNGEILQAVGRQLKMDWGLLPSSISGWIIG